MKKPTCETCVYFEMSEQFFTYSNDGSISVKSRDGMCCCGPVAYNKMLCNYCGEHQDFDKWIEETRRESGKNGENHKKK